MPPITRDLARCGNCRRWASVPDGTALPVGTLITPHESGNWMATFPAGTTAPDAPSACGGCGAPMVMVDMTAHHAELPVRQNTPAELAELERQKARAAEAKKEP